MNALADYRQFGRLAAPLAAADGGLEDGDAGVPMDGGESDDAGSAPEDAGEADSGRRPAEPVLLRDGVDLDGEPIQQLDLLSFNNRALAKETGKNACLTHLYCPFRWRRQ